MINVGLENLTITISTSPLLNPTHQSNDNSSFSMNTTRDRYQGITFQVPRCFSHQTSPSKKTTFHVPFLFSIPFLLLYFFSTFHRHKRLIGTNIRIYIYIYINQSKDIVLQSMLNYVLNFPFSCLCCSFLIRSSFQSLLLTLSGCFSVWSGSLVAHFISQAVQELSRMDPRGLVV